MQVILASKIQLSLQTKLRRTVLKAQGLSSFEIFRVENALLLKKRVIQLQRWRTAPREELPPPSAPVPEILVRLRCLHKTRHKPRYGERVTIEDKEHGTITRVLWEDGEVQEVYVQIQNSKEIKIFEGSAFQGNYDDRGGHTRWQL